MSQSLALSMIVKNSAKTIRRAVEPFLGVIDEMVIADTGSTDGTVEILEEMGVKPLHYRWKHDYGAARNFAWEPVKSDWGLSLDADEWVTPAEARILKEMIGLEGADAFLLDTINYTNTLDDGSLPTSGDDMKIAKAYFLSVKVRLARKRLPGKRDLRWEGVIHELLDLDARRLGYRFAKTDLVVKHDGLVGGLRSDYYRKLCEKAYRRGDAHASVIFVLGLEVVRLGKLQEAEKFWKEAIAKEKGFASPYIWLSKLYRRTGRAAEAVPLLHDGLRACAVSPLAPQLVAEMIDLHTELGERECVAVLRDTAQKLGHKDPYLDAALRRADEKFAGM